MNANSVDHNTLAYLFLLGAAVLAAFSIKQLILSVGMGICDCWCGPGKCECGCGCKAPDCPCFHRDKSAHNDEARHNLY